MVDANPNAAVRTPRRRTYPATALRLERLRYGLTLAAVATRAGLTLTRASFVERDPAIGTADEIDALQAAIAALASPDTGRAA